MMTKQFNIRSEKAHALAVDLSKRRGKSLTQVVEDALEAYDQRVAAKEAYVFGPLLREAQAAARRSPSDIKIEDLYDPETGLPC